MKGKLTEKQLRERKVLSVAPLVIVPLLALCFHALGGGKGVPAKGSKPVVKGVNMSLPDARFDPKKKALNKLGLYSQAESDSLKLLRERRQDPYARHMPVDTFSRRGWMDGLSGADTPWRHTLMPGQGGLQLGGSRSQTDLQADELLGKLDRLKDVLRHQQERTAVGASADRFSAAVHPAYERPASSLVVRPGGDPDLDKLNAMLDKVLKIQHPQDGAPDSTPNAQREQERVVSTLSPATVGRRGADTGEVLGVGNIPDPGGRKGDEDDGLGSGFMDIDGTAVADSVAETTVRAAVARDQTLVSGASVELRLNEQAVIGGQVIPRGSPIWGKATLTGERCMVAVTSVRVGSAVVPLSMEVFDLDGMAGIRVEGSINRDAAKAATGDAISSVGVTTVDQTTVAGQATAAGIEAARSLVGRKVRLVRFTLRANYEVLLKNNKSIKR